ncbi:DUF4422 domain-containing protein [Ottowia thiooxydans]|uniref:DUF4422 domain-containing protein n=1 Tax=Ottowia thiooxydans TaxID=219182 RepID=UPI00041A6912|nr:DUF4422 domain-containing protein [Ottowia thiooxydans]
MLNWRIRYQRILKDNPELFDPKFSILEVGGNPHGIADLLERKVTTVGGRSQGSPSQWTEHAGGSVFQLPFADNSFDYVICVDTLRFVAKADRGRAINELARVARQEVILSVPCGDQAIQSDLELAVALQRAGREVPGWLHEGFTRQLPSTAEMVKLLSNTGIRFEIHANEALLQHYSGLLLDIFYPFAKQIYDTEQAKEVPGLVLPSNEWEVYYSYRFHLVKNETGNTSQNHLIKAALEQTVEPGIGMYAVYHRRLPLAPDTGITPIYVGEAASQAIAGERTEARDNMRDNSRWCELSGMDEIWRNGPRTEFVGFCHYRRMFEFSQAGAEAAQASSAFSQDGLHAGTPQSGKADMHQARSTLVSYDAYLSRASGTASQHALVHLREHADAIITAAPLDINVNVWDQYATVHNANDLCDVTNLITHRYPHLSPFLAESFGAGAFYANNLFITRWEHFDELCTIWFDVLAAFEEKVPTRTEVRYQKRDIAFLAERIFDVWVRYRVAQGTRLITMPILEITYPGLDISEWSRVPDSAP